MMKRMMFLTVVMTAAGLPYVMSTGSSWWTSLKSSMASSSGDASAAAAPAVSTGTAMTSAAPRYNGGPVPPPGAMGGGKGPPVEGYGTNDLREVINFNATPSWVMSRWPRVTVGLAELNMQGYRVPLVTGTRQDDLAGSLTYYFDENQQTKLIHFRGTTGDPRKLVGLVMSQYKLRPQETGDPSMQLYQVRWNGKPISQLEVHTAHVIRAAQPYSRYQVELALKRP